MKEYLREMYELWLAENEHELTTHGNMKPAKYQDKKWSNGCYKYDGSTYNF